MTADARLHSPAADRNRVPIGDALLTRLPAQGHALELASGTGQHAAHLAALLPHWRWQPSDADPALRASIDAWCHGLPNVAPALALDVTAWPWAGVTGPVQLVFNANLLHIAPWPVCPALMHGAGQLLAPDGLLVLYGPYLEADVPTAPSNRAFDADLRARNPAWGLRRLDDVLAEAARVGLRLHERLVMPANNLLLVLGR